MNLKKYLRDEKAEDNIVSSGDFWDDFKKICEYHVKNNINELKRKGSNLEWEESKFNELITTDALEILTEIAKEYLELQIEIKKRGTNKFSMVPYHASINNWIIFITVFPSALDADFLAQCPFHSYEELERLNRRKFRENENWEKFDIAHWILLLDKEKGKASIHLHTIWSYKRALNLLAYELSRGNPPILKCASIVPIDIMKDDINEFRGELLQEDAIYSEKNKSD